MLLQKLEFFFRFQIEMSSRSLRKLQEQKDEVQEDLEESGEEVRARAKSNFNAFLLVRGSSLGDQFD